MSITDNEEHKALRDSYTKAFYVTGQHYAGQIGVAFDKGSETTELLLTAQHDKEMEEFEDWYRQFIMYQPYEDEKWVVLTNPNQDAKSFTELLALFRNRNK